MYLKILQNYLYRKSCRAAIAAIKQIDLCKGGDTVYLKIPNTPLTVDLKLLQGTIKDILIKKLNEEAGK